MNVADGAVISRLLRRHRATEFKNFLTKIDAQVPDGLEIHLIYVVRARCGLSPVLIVG